MSPVAPEIDPRVFSSHVLPGVQYADARSAVLRVVVNDLAVVHTQYGDEDVARWSRVKGMAINQSTVEEVIKRAGLSGCDAIAAVVAALHAAQQRRIERRAQDQLLDQAFGPIDGEAR
jgi:hypothetical protein